MLISKMKTLIIVKCLDLTISRITSMPLSASRRSSIHEVITGDLTNLSMKKDMFRIDNWNLITVVSTVNNTLIDHILFGIEVPIAFCPRLKVRSWHSCCVSK